MPATKRRKAKRKPMPLVGETRDMRLLSQLLVQRQDVTLAEFIAYRRAPGETWLSWDEIGKAIGVVTGEPVTHESARRWAIRLGVPVDTRHNDGPSLASKYERDLIRIGLRLKDVLHKGRLAPQP